MKQSELYEAAANLLVTRGWCQDRFECDGSLCMAGALNVAAGLEPDDIDVHSWLTGRLWSQLGRKPTDWNDEPGRTKDDVVTALRQAALDARREGR